MSENLLINNPFAVLTFIAAPALLTNATSVLAMSTINRMLRTRDRMSDLFKESESATKPGRPKFVEQMNRVEQQAMLLLRALRWIYVALSAFAGAALVTLLGALAGQLTQEGLMRIIIGVGLFLGFVGVGGLIGGCAHLFKATQLSLVNIHEEAKMIRERQAKLNETADSSRS